MKDFAYFSQTFAEFQAGRGLKPGTIRGQGHHLGVLFSFLEGLPKKDLRQVDHEDLMAFIRWLEAREHYEKVTIYGMVLTMRSFFTFLASYDHLLSNPAEKLPIRHLKAHSQRRGCFTREEIEAFLSAVSLANEHRQRDRAVFELMYSSGLRIGESEGLNISDVDLRERSALVREGKGERDRVVPFSTMAAATLAEYLGGERKAHVRRVRKEDQAALYLAGLGRMRRSMISKRFSMAMERANLADRGLTVHSIRHACASHLLAAGADVRYVSELLGHRDLSTTAIYTHVGDENLRRVYKTCHPRENALWAEVDDKYREELEGLQLGLGKKWGMLDKMGL